MRALLTPLAVAALLGACATGALAADALPKPQELLGWSPSQPGVECDTPTDPAVIAACKTETVLNAKKKPIGYALRDGQGKLVRKFVDARGVGKLNQWSYYQEGFEVYRDVDLDGDLHIDECRWMNTAGTRHLLVSKGKVRGWKRLSAEEASKVFVQALVSKDLDLLETVMVTPEELSELGVPKREVDRQASSAKQRTTQLKALLHGLSGWDKQTVWLRFDGTMPHVIPADTNGDLKSDVTLYENAVIFVGPPNGQGDASKFAYLQAGEMLRVGDVWKFVDLPKAIDPNKPIVAGTVEGGIRASLFREPDAVGGENPQLAEVLQALGQYDAQHANVLTGGNKQALAEFYRGRVPLLRNVVKNAASPDDQLLYNKQIADSLASAYQTGLYPRGLEPLGALINEGGKIGSYASYRKIMAENALKAEEPGANPIAMQKDLLAGLEDFLTKYPSADEAPEVLLQLASFNEFNAEEEQARKFYEKLAGNFAGSEAGKKATGALRRLDLVGKSIDLRGPGLRGEAVDVAATRGKTLLVTFWATWASPAKNDMPDLVKLYQKYKSKGLEIVAVNLDNDRATLDAFLKDTPLPWPQIFEQGGMDSRLANEFGIISLPTMFLVDAQGKVVNRNIRTAAELEKQLDKLGLGASATTALDTK